MALMLLRRHLNLYSKGQFLIRKTRSQQIYANNLYIFRKSYQSKNRMLLQRPYFEPYLNLIRTNVSVKEYKKSNYAGHWKFERLLGGSLIFMIPTAFALESKEFEMALGTVALTHTYLGCQSMCSDYLRPLVVGKAIPIIARFFIVIASLSSLAGIYQLIYKDIGIVGMITKFWAIRGKNYVSPKKNEQKIGT